MALAFCYVSYNSVSESLQQKQIKYFKAFLLRGICYNTSDLISGESSLCDNITTDLDIDES